MVLELMNSLEIQSNNCPILSKEPFLYIIVRSCFVVHVKQFSYLIYLRKMFLKLSRIQVNLAWDGIRKKNFTAKGIRRTQRTVTLMKISSQFHTFFAFLQ